MGKAYTFKGLLTNTGWIENATVEVDVSGKIVSIEKDSSIKTEFIDGYALPGFQNAHSHAFQYAMAGLAELHEGSGTPDDFWSWRNAMYNLALTVSPEQLEAIATMLYAEMVRHGYTAVAEFHYLHHDKNGKPYANVAELGERLISAAKKAGIHITLVPMFYQQGGFGKPAEEKQRRFISKTIDNYYKLLESSMDIKTVCNNLKNGVPFHIHVSEQLKEIEDCLSFYGKKPVQWLLDNCNVNDNYHLVHATHLDDSEVNGIARSQANVVLCPSTEGNLGDGLFRFNDYKNLGGYWSIGTDSHVGLNPFEELRVLDYGQRLTTHKRNTYFEPNKCDSGFNAIEMAFKTGRKAMGKTSETFFEMGQSFDAVIMDVNSPLVATSSTKNLCNTFVYSSDISNVLGTIVNGQWVSEKGKHKDHSSISKDFMKALEELKTRK